MLAFDVSPVAMFHHIHHIVRCFPDEWLELGDYAAERSTAEIFGKMGREKSEEDDAIAELLEPLLRQQRAKDYADLLNHPAAQKPLLNNDWTGLAEKVWSTFEMIDFLVIIRLFTSENYLEANVDKEDTKAIWKVCIKASSFDLVTSSLRWLSFHSFFRSDLPSSVRSVN